MIPIRDLNPTRSTPWVTWTLLLLCGLVFIWQAVLPVGADRDFVFAYGLIPRRVMFSQDPAALLTIFTSMFMHGGLMHIIGNLWFLRLFGDNVEDNMGPVRFTIFYLLCGLAAAGAQIAMSPASGVPMVGASGAIAGVLAAYLVLYPHARVVALVPIFIFIQFMEIPAFVFIALWFGLQFFSGIGSIGASGGGVAYWAHIGGFVAGLALVYLFRTPHPPAPRMAFERSQPHWRNSRGW
ncbi:MAG: rhomboid family intramembrane serine protease [Deltaproteobacteria bacterium]|nr:rhomboid family intramembrane serine protease [Myxococcales bacterium]MDP3219135.1 rhomboid family intramembrane serine protease [Deltaproteobacteria bacterium]